MSLLPRTRALTLIAVAVVFAAVAAFGAPRADAHSFLVRSDPQPGARLKAAPRSLQLFFSEPFVAHSVRVSITAGGKPLALPAPTERGAVVGQRLPAGIRGVVVVSWRGVADDGHLTAGEFAFGVRAAAAAVPAAQATSGPISWDEAAIQWAFFVGLALALGGLISEVVVWRADRHFRVEPPVPAPVRPGIALAMLAALLYLLLLAGQGAGGGLAAGLDGGALSNALGSRPGVLTLVVLGALAIAQLLVPVRRRALAIAALLAAVAAVSLRGHAGTSGHAWAVAADALHLTAAAFWVGALAHVVIVVARGSEDPLRARAVAAVRRYSGIALPAVLLLLASGVVDALGQFRGFSDLIDTSYGRTLLIKGGVVAVALSAALLARERGLPTALSTLRTGLLGRLTRGELTALAGVLLAAAVLSSAAPPRSSAEAAPAPRLGLAPLSGPILRLGDLAGNIVVGLETNGRELRFTVLPPIPSRTMGVRLKVEVDRPGRRPADLYPRRCGRTCFTMRFTLPRGTTRAEATVTATGWAGGIARFRIKWPPGPDRSDLLRAVTRTMRSVGRFTLTEAVTSGPGSHSRPTTARTTGRELFAGGEVYAKGASDVRVLRRWRGRTELAFALPGSQIWYRMTVDRRHRVLKERIVSPGHLIRRTFRYRE